MTSLPSDLDFAKYAAWFWQNQAAVVLEQGAEQLGPLLRLPPSPYRWRLEWVIQFSNFKYIRICENWSPKTGGGSHRNHYSFHYGDTPALRDSKGWPKYHHTEPVVLRIDMMHPQDFHLHFDGKNHIPEDAVSGLDFRGLTLFTFLQAVIQHRETGTSIDKSLGFFIH